MRCSQKYYLKKRRLAWYKKRFGGDEISTTEAKNREGESLRSYWHFNKLYND